MLFSDLFSIKLSNFPNCYVKTLQSTLHCHLISSFLTSTAKSCWMYITGKSIVTCHVNPSTAISKCTTPPVRCRQLVLLIQVHRGTLSTYLIMQCQTIIVTNYHEEVSIKFTNHVTLRQYIFYLIKIQLIFIIEEDIY